MDILKKLRDKMQAFRKLPEEEKISQKQLLTNILNERRKNKNDVDPFYILDRGIIALAQINTLVRTGDKVFIITLSNGENIPFAFLTVEKCDAAFIELIHKWNEYYSKTQIVFQG